MTEPTSPDAPLSPSELSASEADDGVHRPAEAPAAVTPPEGTPLPPDDAAPVAEPAAPQEPAEVPAKP